MYQQFEVDVNKSYYAVFGYPVIKYTYLHIRNDDVEACNITSHLKLTILIRIQWATQAQKSRSSRIAMTLLETDKSMKRCMMISGTTENLHIREHSSSEWYRERSEVLAQCEVRIVNTHTHTYTYTFTEYISLICRIYKACPLHTFLEGCECSCGLDLLSSSCSSRLHSSSSRLRCEASSVRKQRSKCNHGM